MPANLAYPTPSAHFLVEVPITEVTPSVDGVVTGWSVQPALPDGLLFDPETGRISGTPQVPLTSSGYIITASGPDGSTSTVIELAVAEPPAYAYVAHGDDTIGLFTVDAFDGGLTHSGLTFAPEFEPGAQDVVVHPSGRFLWVPNESPNFSTNDVSFYTLDPATGRPTAQSAVEFQEGRHSMALTPDGTTAFIASYHSHLIQAFDVDPVTGVLTPNGAPLATGTSPERVVVDPLGRYVWVTNFNSRNLYVYPIDEATGALIDGVDGLSFFTRTPTDVALDPTGTYLYCSFLETEEVQRFTVDHVTGNHIWGPSYSTGAGPSSITMHPTGRFAYVTNADGGDVTQYAVDSKDGDLTALGSVAAGVRPLRMTLDASGNYAYVVDESSGELLQAKVDLKSGALGFQRSLRTRSMPRGLALSQKPSPLRRVPAQLYAANTGSSSLSQLDIDPLPGTLTPIGADLAAGATPGLIALDPLDRFAFTADGQTVRRQLLDPATGALTDDGVAVILGGEAGGLAVDPSGQYLIASIDGLHLVRAYAIDPVLGTLTLESQTATDSQPGAVSVDPTGRFVHVSGQFDIRTWTFSGGLFSAAPTIVSAPTNPGPLTFSPDGDVAFVPMRSTGLVIPYSVSPHDGALTAIVAGVVDLGDEAQSLTLHPRGNHAWVSQPTAGGVVHLAVDTETGNLTLLETLSTVTTPEDLATTPDGRHVFASNPGGDEVLILDVDGNDGSLELVGQQPVGVAPGDLALRSINQ